MTVERRTSALVGGRHLSSEEVRNQRFQTQIFGGYSTDEVNRFMGRAAREIDRLYELLEQANNQAAQVTQQFPAQVAAPAPDHQVTRVLQMAQKSADALLAESRHQADTMLEHARQQGERIVSEARQHANASAQQIIENATAESRHQVARYLQLADKIRKGLAQGAGTLHTLLGEWAQEAGPEVTDVVHPDPPAEPAATEETADPEPSAARRRTAPTPKQG